MISVDIGQARVVADDSLASVFAENGLSVTTCDDLVTTYFDEVVTAESVAGRDFAQGCDDCDDLFPTRTHTRAHAHARFFNIGRHGSHRLLKANIDQSLRLCRPARKWSSQGRHRSSQG